MFHKVTKDVINFLSSKSLETDDRGHLEFLLKVYCFEIDIDPATDVTVDRNLRFVLHAIKLIKIIEDEINVLDAELKFYIAYLHCSIGTTFVYERTKIDEAHFHLMKARKTALDIVKASVILHATIACTSMICKIYLRLTEVMNIKQGQ